LKNTADIGMPSLVQEWIANHPGADKQLALCVYPDLWTYGGYEVYTKGLTFCGAKPEDMPEILKGGLKAEYLGILERFEALSGGSGKREPAKTAASRNWLVERVSFVGNNCGFVLDVNGLDEDAFEIYSRVRKFDPGNVSALLNYAIMIRNGMRPDLKEECERDLIDFKNNLQKPISVWELSRKYGYVNNPEVFAKMGWTWAYTGGYKAALKALDTAMQNNMSGNHVGILETMANIYMRDNDVENSEKTYKQILEEDPGNKKVLVGLARLYASNGRLDEANEYFTKAREAGVAINDLIYERAAMYILNNQMEMARSLAGELSVLEPENARSYILLVHIHQLELSGAKTQAEFDAAVAAMTDAVGKMDKMADADEFQILFLKGTISMSMRRFDEARTYFESALNITKLQPQWFLVMERLLTLDASLGDKRRARMRARAILNQNADHYFANYIMGSLVLEEGNHESAEEYLERADKSNPHSIIVINDLACVKLKLGKFDEAEAVIGRAFEMGSTLYAVYDTLGEILYAKGDYQGAYDNFLAAVKLNTDTPDLRVALHLAAAAFKLGNVEEARGLMETLEHGAVEFKGDEKVLYLELKAELKME